MNTDNTPVDPETGLRVYTQPTVMGRKTRLGPMDVTVTDCGDGKILITANLNVELPTAGWIPIPE